MVGFEDERGDLNSAVGRWAVAASHGGRSKQSPSCRCGRHGDAYFPLSSSNPTAHLSAQVETPSVPEREFRITRPDFKSELPALA